MDVEDALDFVHLVCEVLRALKGAVWLECALTIGWVGELDGEVVAYLVNQDDGLLIKPLHSAAVLPKPILDAALRVVDVRAEAVLLAFMPPPLIFAAVGPVVNAKALFLVHEVLPVVAHSIRVDVDTVALHVIRLPLTVILAAVLPQVDTVSVDLVV